MIHAPTLSDGLAAYYGGRAKIFGVSGKDRSAVSMAAQDDRSYEVDLKGYGHVFPHPFGQADDKLFCTRILVSPIGDQLTLDFSKALIAHEQMGRDEIPDYLSISFSAVDAVNHFFGPSSLENEDVVVQLDRTLADLLAFIDKNDVLGGKKSNFIDTQYLFLILLFHPI